MRIVFLTRYADPDDVNIWSGTFSYMYHTLQESHEVICMGGEILAQLRMYQSGNFQDNRFVHERYLKVLGRLLAERIDRLDYDVVFFGDNYFVPYLKCKIPIVRISDVTFQQFKDYLNYTDESKIKRTIEMERLALNNYAHTIYPSEWIKRKTIEYYSINPDTIDVVEFGANIPTPVEFQTEIDMQVCNLVFIGKNWKKKGGDKVLGAYKKLKTEGFSCTLTIIGSVPDMQQGPDNDITVIPFLNKLKPDDLEKLCSIYYKSHFLILPTEYDAFGIVFCEASAYAVPSIATDVCGVSQPVREGKNGFLLPPHATAEDYAKKIRTVFSDKDAYLQLRASSRREYETRLNLACLGKTG